MATGKKKSSEKKGLTVKTYGGLSESRMASKQGSGKRLFLPKGKTVPVVFLTGPDQMKEYDQHVWKEGSKWKFVPCVEQEDGECPFCSDDDPQVAKTSYVFAANVWDVKNKCVRVMTGPTKLSMLVLKRYKSRKKQWLKTVFDVTQMNVTPVQYDIDATDEDLPRIKGDLYDLEEFVQEEFDNFMGNEKVKNTSKSRSTLDDDDEDDESEDADDDEPHTKADLKEMPWKDLKKLARSLDIDTEDKKRTALVREIMEAEE